MSDGFTREEVRVCDVCKGPIGLCTYRVIVEQHILDSRAIQQQAGLEMMLDGNVGIAQALGPNKHYSTNTNEVKSILCQQCVVMKLPVECIEVPA